MRRRFNYTGRKRIAKQDVAITISETAPGQKRFYCDLNLGAYELPDDSRVWVEAYDRNNVARFDFGTIAETRAQYDTELSEFADTDEYKFRIKVTDRKHKSRLLALAKQIRAVGSDDEETARAILKIGRKSLRARPWTLEFEESDYPTLFIDNNIDAGISLARSNGFFQAAVLPIVMEQVLEYIIYKCEYRELGEPEPEDEWKEAWLIFGGEMLGNSEFPSGEPSDDELDRWIEEAVNGFCAQMKMIQKMRIHLREVET